MLSERPSRNERLRAGMVKAKTPSPISWRAIPKMLYTIAPKARALTLEELAR